MAIITGGMLFDYLGLTAAEARLEYIASGIDAAIKSVAGMDIEQTTYPAAPVGGLGDSGYYSGDGSRFLFLRQTPVTTLTSIYYDQDGYFGTGTDPYPSDTLLVEGTDYVLHKDGCLPGTSTKCSYEGRIERIGGVWAGATVRTGGNLTRGQDKAIGNIKVVYTAGFPVIPGNIILAALELGARVRATSKSGGAFESEDYEDYSYKIGQQGEAISAIVAMFRAYGVNKRRLVA